MSTAWPVDARSNVRVVASVRVPQSIFWAMLVPVPEADAYENRSQVFCTFTAATVALREASPTANERSPDWTAAPVYSMTCHSHEPPTPAETVIWRFVVDVSFARR